jgi:hypothetical protein
MGTDRDTVFEGACKCGKGFFQIDYCSPDHGWPTSTPFWYESSIRCITCRETFELQTQGNNIVLVEKSEVRKRQALAEESHKRGQDLFQTPEVRKLLNELTELLNKQKSAAAIHRLLQAADLEYNSVGTFRKRWNGSEAWIKGNVWVHNLPKVMKLLGSNDKVVMTEIKEIEKLSKESQAPPLPIGKPVYTIKQEA